MINVDRELLNRGIGGIISRIIEAKGVIEKPWHGTVVVVNEPVYLKKYSLNYNLEYSKFKSSNNMFNAENIIRGFGEMGYQYLEYNNITKYYNCMHVTFGEYTAKVIDYLSIRLDSILDGAFSIELDLEKVPFDDILRKLGIDYDDIFKTKKYVLNRIKEKLDKSSAQIIYGSSNEGYPLIEPYIIKSIMEILDLTNIELNRYQPSFPTDRLIQIDKNRILIIKAIISYILD